MKKVYKLNKTLTKTISNSSHLTQTHKKQFRTLLKRRNQTISSSQLYERSPSAQKPLNNFKNLSLSQASMRKSTSKGQSMAVNIKDYVRMMGNKKQQRISQSRKTSRNVHLIHDDDSASIKSSRLVLSTSLIPKEFAFEKVTQKRTLADLQQKIQEVTMNIFQKLQNQKSRIGLSKWSQLRGQKSVEKEFQEIRQWFNELREKLEQSTGQKMEDLSKKIAMIEKMIAAQNVESQVLKKQYYNWKNQRTNTASFASKKQLAESIRYNGTDKMKRQLFSLERPKQIVAQYSSSSSLFYKKPALQSYNKSIAKKNTYSVNRQPLPRSNYSTDFLNYGYFPTYCYKQGNSRKLPEVSLAVKASNYQQEYKEKLGINKTVDFKELDCFKDKFKKTNISFMNTSKKDYIQLLMKNKQNKQNKLTFKQSTHKEIKKSQESLIGCMNSTYSLAQTEHQKQFIWHNTLSNDQILQSPLLKSEIKDKSIAKMKENFRMMTLRK